MDIKNVKIKNLDLTIQELINFISIYQYILYAIINYDIDILDDDDISFLSILEEYSYKLRG